MYTLPSSLALSRKLRDQMGDYAYIRYCRNAGVSIEDVFCLMFGKMPLPQA